MACMCLLVIDNEFTVDIQWHRQVEFTGYATFAVRAGDKMQLKQRGSQTNKNKHT